VDASVFRPRGRTRPGSPEVCPIGRRTSPF
jgi:hypothetical protein